MRESPRPTHKKEKEAESIGAGNALLTGIAAGGALLAAAGGSLKNSNDNASKTENSAKEHIQRENPDEIPRMVRDLLRTPIQGFDERHFTKEQLQCLTDNVYHEARGEPKQGRYAVVFATLERVLDKKFPKSICGVVHQPWQFSWTKDEKILAAPINPKEYLRMALEVYELTRGRTLDEAAVEAGLRAGLPHGSIYYKDARFTGSERVQKFFATLHRVGQIGTHEFFIVPEHVSAHAGSAPQQEKKAHNVVPIPGPRPPELKAEDAKMKRSRRAA
jgi:spore germination cell wall hydrolase CwlJ-like protein